MVLNKGKCHVLPLVRVNPMHQDKLGTEQLETSFVEKDLGVLVDTKLTMGQKTVLTSKKAKRILAFVRKNIDSRQRD